MTHTRSFSALNLANQLAQGYYLRTAHLLRTEVFLQEIQQKFNSRHRPDNGQFDFGPSGSRLASTPGNRSASSSSTATGRPPRSSANYPIRIELPRSEPKDARYPQRFILSPSIPVDQRPDINQTQSQPVIRFSHSEGIDLPDQVVAKANHLSEAVRAATGHQIHVTSGRRDADRQATAMYNNYLQGHPPHYANVTAHAEVHQVFEKGRTNRSSRNNVIAAMASVLTEQMKRGIYLSRHMTSKAIDIRTPPATVLHAIRRHPSVQSVGVEDDHIHIQFH
jgi:hypothetical protein